MLRSRGKGVVERAQWTKSEFIFHEIGRFVFQRKIQKRFRLVAIQIVFLTSSNLLDTVEPVHPGIQLDMSRMIFSMGAHEYQWATGP